MKNSKQIYLSPPNVSEEESRSVISALNSGWVAPVGPSLDEFESKLASYYGKEVVALNSGTSALHLALILAGVSSDDHVVVGTHTFASCANVIFYQNAVPVFIDSESDTWNLDPELLDQYLSKAEIIPKAIIVTHIYGIPAKILDICAVAKKYGVKVIEDGAESLGSLIEDRPLATFGDYGVVSFNGNKIITTSGGGALVCPKEELKKAVSINWGPFVGKDSMWDEQRMNSSGITPFAVENPIN